MNFKLSVSPSSKLYFQAGATLQQSIYKEDQVLFEADANISGEKTFN